MLPPKVLPIKRPRNWSFKESLLPVFGVKLTVLLGSVGPNVLVLKALFLCPLVVEIAHELLINSSDCFICVRTCSIQQILWK